MNRLVLVSIGIALLAAAAFALGRIKQYRHWSALFEAIQQRDYASFLQSANKCFGAMPLSDRRQLVLFACGKGEEDVVRWLSTNGVDLHFVDRDGYTPLIIAATSNSPETVQYLLSVGADVHHRNAAGYSALEKCVLAGRPRSVDVAALLLNAGAKPVFELNKPGALEYAIKVGNTNMIHLLMQYVPRREFTPEERQSLFSWVWGTNTNVINFLSNLLSVSKN